MTPESTQDRCKTNFQKSITPHPPLMSPMPDPQFLKIFCPSPWVRGGGGSTNRRGTLTTTCLTFSGTRGGVLYPITRPVAGWTHPI